MRRAKNAWFMRIAAAAQKGRNKGKVVWQCIRDIKRGRRGLVPMRTAVVRDEDSTVGATLQSCKTEVEEALLSDSESPE